MKKIQILLILGFCVLCGLFAIYVFRMNENKAIKDNPAHSNEIQGKLFIHGGGSGGQALFANLFPDKNQPIVLIPTAEKGDSFGPSWPGLKVMKEAGFTNLTLLHTRDPNIANEEQFVEPLRKAKGVWIFGGRQWRLADAYLHTRVQEELNALLQRGGIIGGSSAGAAIQGSFLVRGDTKSNTIMIGDHTEGFGFLKNTAIDIHLLTRNRQFDLLKVIDRYPDLLGIGIDEGTAIVVTGDTFEIVGNSKVAVYERKSADKKATFTFLSAGDKYNLLSRKIIKTK